MNVVPGSAQNAKPGAPRAPEGIRWDVGSMESHRCSIAVARATSAEVVLNFGERRREESKGEVGTRAVACIALSPLTAKTLAATLRRLIEEHDGGAR